MKSLFKNLRFKNLWEIGCPSNPISTSTKNSSKREKLIRWLASPVSLTLLLSQFSIVVPVKPAIADTTGSICAVPGKDGTTNQQQIVNTYFPGRPNTTVATGATSITLGSYHTGGANVPISPGDMLMVVSDARRDY